MELAELLERVHGHGKRAKKYTGALSIELLRRALYERGIRTSPRDVFIEGVPVEIDLLIPADNAQPELELIYCPEDVLAVLEVKTRGSFGQKKSLDPIRRAFRLIRESNPRIRCAYVTLAERINFKDSADEKKLECVKVFILSSYTSKDENRWEPSRGEWEGLLSWLGALSGTNPRQTDTAYLS